MGLLGFLGFLVVLCSLFLGSSLGHLPEWFVFLLVGFIGRLCWLVGKG